MTQLIRKVLAFGQLTSSKADLYAPTAGTKGFIHTAELHNTGASDETVVLNHHDGSSEEQLYKLTVVAYDTVILDFRGVGNVVDDGGKITGSTTTATTVSFKLSGTEETPSAVASAGGGVAVTSNLWAPPTSPHDQDDEFEASTLVGWSGPENLTDEVSGTFSYDTVNPYDTTFNSGDAVRVNVNPASRPSWALIQVPSRDKFYGIYKAYTLPTNLLVVARMKFNMRATSPIANDAGVGVCFFGLTTGKPTNNSRVASFVNEDDDGACQGQAEYKSSVGGIVSTETTDVDFQGQALHYAAVHKIGTDYHCWVGTSDGNWMWLDSYSGIDFTPDAVGLVLTNNSVLAPGVSVVAVDFVRFFETDKFLF